MTTPVNASVYSQGFGTVPNGTANPVFSTAAPSSTLVQYHLGQRYINTVANNEYSLTSFTSSNGVLSATWTQLNGGGGGGGVATVNSLSPISGDIEIAGTADNIAVSNATNTITLSLAGPYAPTTYTATGVLIGNDSGAITATSPGVTGLVLTGLTSSAPSFQDLGTNSGLTDHGVLLAQGNAPFSATDAGDTGTVLTGNGAGSDPSFQALPSTILTWVSVAGTTETLAASTAYLLENAGLTTVTLPVTCPGFAVIQIQGLGAGGWTIAQNSGQSISMLEETTTGGVTGSLNSVGTGAGVTLLCTVDNASFEVISSIGNFTLV